MSGNGSLRMGHFAAMRRVREYATFNGGRIHGDAPAKGECDIEFPTVLAAVLFMQMACRADGPGGIDPLAPCLSVDIRAGDTVQSLSHRVTVTVRTNPDYTLPDWEVIHGG